MGTMAKSADQVDADLILFVHFANEKRPSSSEEVVRAINGLFNHCPTTRPAVLSLFASIFDEYCLHFVQTSAGNPTAARLGAYLSLICTSSSKADVRRVSCERRMSSESSNTDVKETPASPPPFSSDEQQEEEEQDRFHTIDSFVNSLAQSLSSLMDSDNMNINRIIADWALTRLCQMASHFQPLKERIFSCGGLDNAASASAADSINEKIKYWRNCTVIDVLIKLVLKSMEKGLFDLKDVLLHLMNFKPETGNAPQTEWISCCIITSAQTMTEISSCIKFLLHSNVSESAKESIFSFLSTQNPESVIICSKSNIPFLLRLCSKSKALLDVLSQQITCSPVDIHELNHMQNLSITANTDLQKDMITCLLSSENSFDLLLTLCQVATHPDSEANLLTQAFELLNAVVSDVHECVYSGRANKIALFMDQLKLNYMDIISNKCFNESTKLKRVQMRLIQILSYHFGIDFFVLLFHQLFNETTFDNKFDVHSMSELRPNSALASLFETIKLTFGRQMIGICNKVLACELDKSDNFWINFLSFAVTGDEAFDVELDSIAEHLTDFLEIDMYDLHSGGCKKSEPLVIVLELISLSVSKTGSQACMSNHNLCASLVINYVNLVERMERNSEEPDAEEEEVEKLMTAICSSQNIMKSLSKSGSGSTNQQMLTRTFMDCILSWNKELEEEKRMRDKSEVDVRLKSENVKYGGAAFKFRKIPLNPGKDFYSWKNRADRQPLLSRPFSRQLLLDGIKCCIRQMDLFSHLLVETITPDVMFNDMVWPDEDFLKVTIERDLLICKKYESHCILWDLTELVAEHGLLRNCSVLIRALLALQLTYWASGTSSEVPEREPLEATQRLIALLAKSGLIPEVPFKYMPQVLPHLTSWEIFCVANDLWKLIRDTAMNQCSGSLLKPYLDRLRVIMGHKCPGPTFVKIFKDLQ